MDFLSLANKVSIITGASSGIGRATAILFAKLGSRISLVGRNKDRLEETRRQCLNVAQSTVSAANSDAFLCIEADLADSVQVVNIFQQTMAYFSQLDILGLRLVTAGGCEHTPWIHNKYLKVNNAGCIMNDTAEDFDFSRFENLMKVNLHAVMILTHCAIPALIKTKGSIVNVSSVCGSRSFPSLMSYCVSKAALDQFTRCTALDMASKGVRVNSVNPGVIVTELQKRGGMSDETYAQFLERSKETHALGRPGEAEEVARAIAFLASSASSFTTGDLLMVDGGRNVMCPR